MRVGDAFKKFYYKLEDFYYKIIDFFTNKGIPLSKADDWLYNKGIPTAALFYIIILALAIALPLTLIPTYSNLTVTVHDDLGELIEGARITLETEQGINTKYSDNAGKALYQKIKDGTEVTVTVTKEGYRAAEERKTFFLEEDTSQDFVLAKITAVITGRLMLKNNETESIIGSAQVEVYFAGQKLGTFVPDKDGVVSLEGVPKGQEIELRIKSDSYESQITAWSFDSDSLTEFGLTPKDFGPGETSVATIGVFDSTTRLPIEDAFVKVIDKELDLPIVTGNTDIGGIIAGPIPKGTVIKLVAEKEGYALYDSTSEAIADKTVLADMQWNIEMRQAEGRLTVKAKDANTGTLLSEVTIGVYNDQAELLTEQSTDAFGNANFTALDPSKTYYFTGWRRGFLPARNSAIPAGQSIEMLLTPITPQNSAKLVIQLVDVNGNPVPTASVKLYESMEGKKLPLGVPMLYSDQIGIIELDVKKNSSIIISALTDTLKGGDTVEITEQVNKKEIVMTPIETTLEIVVQDEKGTLLTRVQGSLTSSLGETIWAGTIDASTIISFSGYNDIVLRLDKNEYSSYEEAFTMKEGERQKIFAVLKKGFGHISTDKPSIKFVGVYSMRGEKLGGVAKNGSYLLKYETTWPGGEYNGGMHFRVGSDDKPYASQEAMRIQGFEANVDWFFYGRSYTPANNEPIDMANRGFPAGDNKFLEMKENNPEGVKLVSVKIEVRGAEPGQTLQAHHRAWAEYQGNYIRIPEDPNLKLLKTTPTYNGLYAETFTEEITVYEELPKCAGNLCYSVAFLDKDRQPVSPENYVALLGKESIMKVELQALAGLSAEATLEAKSNAVVLNTYSEGIPGAPAGAEAENVKAVATLKTGERKSLYFYFKPTESSNALLELSFKVGAKTTTEKYAVMIQGIKDLSMHLSDRTWSIGEKKDLTITLKGPEGEKIENATVLLKNLEGTPLEKEITITGEKTTGKGLYGQYIVKDFSPGVGIIDVIAQAFGYEEERATVLIGKRNVFDLKNVYMNIPEGELTAKAIFNVKNKTATKAEDLEFSVEDFDEDVLFTFSPLETIPGGQAPRVDLTAEYRGTKNSFHETGTIRVKGRIGNYLAFDEAEITLDYHKKLESKCIVIDQQTISLLVAAKNDIDEQHFTLKNECNIDLENFQISTEIDLPTGLTLEIVPVNPNALSMFSSGASEEFIARAKTTQDATLDYGTEFKGKARLVGGKAIVEKEVKLNIKVFDPATMLEVLSDKDIVFLVPGQPQVAVNPYTGLPEFRRQEFRAHTEVNLSIKNTGPREVTNIEISLPPVLKESGITALAEPPRIESLAPGESTLVKLKLDAAAPQYRPLPMDRVSGYRTGINYGHSAGYGSGPIEAEIKVLGRGRNNLLIETEKTINVLLEAANCLEVQSASIEFIEQSIAGVSGGQHVFVANRCVEPLMVQGLSQMFFGPNRLMLMPDGRPMQPNETRRYEIRLFKGGDIDYKAPLMVVARAWYSNAVILSPAFTVTLKLGSAARESERGRSYETIEMPLCEAKDKKKEVAFPIVSGDCECSEIGYCDAEHLAKYLLADINEKVKKIKDQLKHRGSSPQNYINCTTIESGYCTFKGLDAEISSKQYYLMNDNLTMMTFQGLLRDKKTFPDLQGYNTTIGALTGYGLGALGMNSATGYGRALQIVSTVPGAMFSGCGRYSVTVDGTVGMLQGSPWTPGTTGQVRPHDAFVGPRLHPDTINVLVEIKGPYPTAECENKVQNVMNFLPCDQAYTNTNRADTMLGIVESSNKNLGEDFAQALFGNKDRYGGQSVSGTNVLDVEIGKTGVTGLAKITMPQTGYGADPRRVRIDVSELGLITGEEVKEEEAKQALINEAAKSMRALRQGNFKVACIGSDESYLVLLSAGEEPQDLEFHGCDHGLKAKSHSFKVPLSPGTSYCCELRIKSNIGDSITLKLEQRRVEGLKSIYFEQDDQSLQTITLTLQKNKEEKIKICGEAEVGPHLLTGKSLGLSYLRAIGDSGTAKIFFKSCGITPAELIKNVAKDEEIYAKLSETNQHVRVFGTASWDPKTYKTGVENKEKFCEAVKKIKAGDRSAFKKRFLALQKGCADGKEGGKLLTAGGKEGAKQQSALEAAIRKEFYESCRDEDYFNKKYGKAAQERLRQVIEELGKQEETQKKITGAAGAQPKQELGSMAPVMLVPLASWTTIATEVKDLAGKWVVYYTEKGATEFYTIKGEKVPKARLVRAKVTGYDEAKNVVKLVDDSGKGITSTVDDLRRGKALLPDQIKGKTLEYMKPDGTKVKGVVEGVSKKGDILLDGGRSVNPKNLRTFALEGDYTVRAGKSIGKRTSSIVSKPPPEVVTAAGKGTRAAAKGAEKAAGETGEAAAKGAGEAATKTTAKAAKPTGKLGTALGKTGKFATRALGPIAVLGTTAYTICTDVEKRKAEGTWDRCKRGWEEGDKEGKIYGTGAGIIATVAVASIVGGPVGWVILASVAAGVTIDLLVDYIASSGKARAACSVPVDVSSGRVTELGGWEKIWKRVADWSYGDRLELGGRIDKLYNEREEKYKDVPKSLFTLFEAPKIWEEVMYKGYTRGAIAAALIYEKMTSALTTEAAPSGQMAVANVDKHGNEFVFENNETYVFDITRTSDKPTYKLEMHKLDPNNNSEGHKYDISTLKPDSYRIDNCKGAFASSVTCQCAGKERDVGCDIVVKAEAKASIKVDGVTCDCSAVAEVCVQQ